MIPTLGFAGMAEVPGIISAPVLLYDEGNNLLETGEYGLIVAFKDALGITLFTEEHLVRVDRGAALISIGNGFAVGSSYKLASGGLNVDVFNSDTDITVEILVEGQSKVQELTNLGSQPYSFISQRAMSVSKDAITSHQIKDGTIRKEDLEESFLEEIKSKSNVVVTNEKGEPISTEINASHVEVNASLGLNNSSGSSLDLVLRGFDTAIDTIRETDLDQSIKVVNTEINTTKAQVTTLQTSLNSHSSNVQFVHGVTSPIVGVSDAQNIKNKTLDASNNISGDAINTGTIAENLVAPTIARDSELNFNNFSGSLSSAQFPTNLAKDITFDNSQCADGACKVDGVDLSQLNENVTSINEKLDDNVEDDRISPYLKPFAYGYIESTNGCENAVLKSGYNIRGITASRSGVSLQFSEGLAQRSDLIMILDDVSNPADQNGLNHDCIWGYGFLGPWPAGLNTMGIAHCSTSSSCTDIPLKKFSFIIMQIPR